VPAVPFIGHAGLFPPFANAAVLKLVEANEAMTSTAIVPAMKVVVIFFLTTQWRQVTIITFGKNIVYYPNPEDFLRIF
jgi:hypothetical protein